VPEARPEIETNKASVAVLRLSEVKGTGVAEVKAIVVKPPLLLLNTLLFRDGFATDDVSTTVSTIFLKESLDIFYLY
jgi:hypothetical protein